jgi:hypothetical protein
MDEPSKKMRLIATALRCYPARWRRRHGDEAAELAVLLIRDGTPAGSIALSYLAGAAREWLTPRLSWRLSAVACALLVAACSLSVSVGLAASAAPAKAASTGQAHGHATRCRTVMPQPVPGAVPAMGHSQITPQEPVHAKSC